MSDDPIFPRSDGRDDDVRRRLAEEARRNLDAEFQKDRICHNCGAGVPAGMRTCPQCWILVVEGKVERKSQPASEDSLWTADVYGPPPTELDSDRPDFPIPVYGPPPSDLEVVSPLYGPPPILTGNSKFEEYPLRPAYGPPPISIVTRNWPWIVGALAVLFFVLAAAVVLSVLLFYYSNR